MSWQCQWYEYQSIWSVCLWLQGSSCCQVRVRHSRGHGSKEGPEIARGARVLCREMVWYSDRRSKSAQFQCRSKGNISREERKRRRCEPLGGSGCIPPSRKFWNLKAWRCYFQRSPRAICDICTSQIIYFIYCVSKSMHIESITLETSITKL